MNKVLLTAALAALSLATACNMNKNPLLGDSPLPYGAPQFDKIKTEHYKPAFEAAIAEGKAEIDAIVSNSEAPTFENTIEALEFAGSRFDLIENIFFNMLEANTNEQMQQLAEELSPILTEYELYVSLNEKLFERIDAVYAQRGELNLDIDQAKLLENTWKSFTRKGAKLNAEDKKVYSELSEQLSLLSLKFGRNVLAATNAFKLNITDESKLEGMPEYVKEMGAAAAAENNQSGWTYSLSAPSFIPFMQFCKDEALRKELYTAFNTRAYKGEFDNSETCREIANTRLKIANLLGFKTYADYALDARMAKNYANVAALFDKLLSPSMPAAKTEVKAIYDYAVANGYTHPELMPWDFSFWSQKYKNATYSLSDEELKPYFKLENCIDAVFGLATKLYGMQFELRKDIPVYHKDVNVYDVKDEDGNHLALLYTDFFPRESKRGGAWKSNFRGQSIVNGVENRPLVTIVMNFSKPGKDAPSLLTHNELTTFLHEFGHAIHGMLGQGRYTSLTGTSVARDFVELPSQIMENWATEAEFLKPFAKHYETGEAISDELIQKITDSKNYLSAYFQVRQLQFGLIDMQWHNVSKPITKSLSEVEAGATNICKILPVLEGTQISPSFSHIFAGGYSAGYYSYKWAEVLEADAWSLFEEKGIFSKEVAQSFKDNILTKGSSEDEAILYRRFRGHDPEPEALLKKLGIEIR